MRRRRGGRGVRRDAAALAVLDRLLRRVGDVHHEGRLVHRALRGNDQGRASRRAAAAAAAAGAGVGAHLHRPRLLLRCGVRPVAHKNLALGLRLITLKSTWYWSEPLFEVMFRLSDTVLLALIV